MRQECVLVRHFTALALNGNMIELLIKAFVEHLFVSASVGVLPQPLGILGIARRNSAGIGEAFLNYGLMYQD